MTKSHTLKETKLEHLEKMRSLLEAAEKQEREFTPGEQEIYNSHKRKVEDLNTQITRAEEREKIDLELASREGKIISQNRIITPSGYVSRSKANNAKFAETLSNEERNYSLGRVIRSMALGNPKIAEAEQRAMSTSGASAAVPAAILQTMLDKIFEQSVIMQAGGTMLQMPGGSVTLPRFTDAGALEVKDENDPFSGDDMSIDGVSLTAKTIGQVFTISRELMEDAPGIDQAIERQLSNLLADALDNYAINGGGGLTGILTASNVSSITSFGAVDGYGFALQGWKKLADEGHNPTALLLNPTTVETLDELIMDSFRTRPEAIQNLPRFVTNKLAANGGSGTNESTAIIGDFSHLLWAIRNQAQIEVSNTAGDAFAKHQVLVKITWRGAFNVAYPKAFCKISGMTFGA
jgi:HK97 family phage major capsid protein